MSEEEVKLEWMYKEETANKVDPEEYLLGKAIDKHFEAQINEGDKVILPASIFANKNSNIAVDTERKMKQDPLVQIKLKEMEMKRQLLKNPVKLKKLQTLLKAHEEKLAREKKHEKKKKKEDIDDILAEKYLKLTKKLGSKSLAELTEKKKKKRKDSDSEEDKKKKRKKSKRENSDDERHRPSVSKNIDRHRYKDNSHKVDTRYSDSEEEKPAPKSYGLILPAGVEPRKNSIGKSEKPKTAEKNDKKVKHKPKKLSEKEKEAKLKEMLKEGKIRDKERKHNLIKYRSEQKDEQKGREYDHDFLRKQMLLATKDSSVEQRIKSNINSVQKSVGFMDKV